MRLLHWLFEPPTNPLEVVLDELAWVPKPVTMQFLDWVAKILKEYGYQCETYGDVIEFLEFMEENGLVVLTQEESSGTYSIYKTNIMDT